MTKPYASGTSVGAEQTKVQIRNLVMKAGGRGWKSGEDEEDGRAVIEWRLSSKDLESVEVRIRMFLELPQLEQFQTSPTGRQKRTATQQAEAYTAEIRRRWRCLHAIVKAKLIAIADGITTVEREFYPNIVIPGTDVTVEQATWRSVKHSLQTGTPMKQLPEETG